MSDAAPAAPTGPTTATSPDSAGRLPDDGAPMTTNLVTATWALFLGLGLLLAGAGLIGTLLGVRSEQLGFSRLVSGGISAAYYAGFLAGSRLALGALGRVGHVRVFAALAALASASVLAQGLAAYPAVWIPMRFVTGLCMAGQYVVAESWLNGLASNENRGRLLAIYMVVTSLGFGAGQLLVAAGNTATLGLFAVASLLFSLAVTPVALSETTGPSIDRSAHISLRELAGIVPTGIGTALLVGVAHGALTGLGPVYATAVGLRPSQVAVFVAAPMVGGVVFQWSISAASDDIDRRAVALAVSLVAVVTSVALTIHPSGTWLSYAAMFVLGGMTFPLYSLAAAYTNDWTPPDRMLAAASQLVTVYGLGALVGPIVAGAIMNGAGPHSFFWTIAAMHAAIAAFVFYRLLAWRTPLAKAPWSEVSFPARAFFIPATVVAVGRRLRPRRER